MISSQCVLSLGLVCVINVCGQCVWSLGLVGVISEWGQWM